MAELKLVLMPSPDIIFSFNTLIIKCLLSARLYVGLGVKMKDHTAVLRSLRSPGADEQMVR